VTGLGEGIRESLVRLIDNKVDPRVMLRRIQGDFKKCIDREIHAISGSLRRLIEQSMSLDLNERPKNMVEVALRVKAI